IRQNNSSLLLYIKSVQSEGTARILGSLKGQSALNAGSKPYVSVRFPKDMDVITALKAVFNGFSG
ncbi:MAG: hypothetical protein IJ725_04375, partial [Ruminococcus sp.]|nr:hypothetical protein [Ruminococcus sp.]